jgi:beta-lactamase superfamily II metal-dependent hydrolase
MLDIFNCGQGDSIRLTSKGCIWDANNPLYIDLGPASYTRAVAENEIDLLITHSHNDHISGMSIPKRVRIRSLYIPAYYPEIRKIVSHLTGRRPYLPSVQQENIKILYEGARSDCRHIEILNPPLNPYTIFGTDLENASGVDEYLERFGTSVDGIINDQADLGDVSLPDGYEPEKFIRVAVQLISRQDKGNIIKAVNRFLEYDANKISVVFSYKYNNDEGNEETFLLTGDADKTVFNRLISA